MFEGFEARRVTVAEAGIFCRVGGSGPALLLLHGYPQTHVMWHKVADRLARDFTVVAADLRGYGDSSRLATAADHAPYSKRAMAHDMAQVMTALGHDCFFVGAHDRGARVAHRLALDHAGRVAAMVLLDIAPTREMYRDTDAAFATAYWHWFLLIQKAPFPETLIGHDPDGYWRKKCGSGSAGLTPFTGAALAEYLRCWRDPAVIHATCEDYRAAATIDIRHDNEDGGRKVACPLRVLWGRTGVIERCFDVLALWRERVEAGGRPCAARRSLPCRGAAGRGVCGIRRLLQPPRRRVKGTP
jgi:haloacetate dehalogenase